ncbi:Udp-glycosyltransferase [Thalictrum thalictroides]|uniref:Udp-glycosyltransferase n=1 Tax=Thalictrum thalictroides TaxID=46969 RepID=A0A7J6X096_THATH|nr:Udp-glycosyltransferase [Thalictrum thalictroides]
MSNSSSKTQSPHVALFPSSGMGHIIPSVRLAASLANKNFHVTMITAHPLVSKAESNFLAHFFAAFPQVISKEFHLLPRDPSTAKSDETDPFFLQIEAIRRSATLLSPLLSSLSPPLSALISDIFLSSTFTPITADLHLPNYILFPSCTYMLCLTAHFPSLVNITEEINIPGLSTMVSKSWLPPPLVIDATGFFATQFVENGKNMVQHNGILMNTFDALEPESLKAINEGKVVNGFPPVISIGPLVPCEFEKQQVSSLAWLDEQPDGSVVYVCFGNRTALSREQLRELGVGLVKSECRFLWILKDKKVDKEDVAEIDEVLGKGFVESVKDKGLVIKSWVDQDGVLSHRAVGGFVSHVGWSSAVEAMWHGVPILAWPQIGDQKMCAAVVKKCGLGLWVDSWDWNGGELVKGEDIGKAIKELMGDENLKLQVAHIKEEARKAVAFGGSSENNLLKLRKEWELCM